MKNTTDIKTRVEKLLTKWGNNIETAKEMIKEGEWAFRTYSGESARNIAIAIINTHGICGAQR